MKFYNDNLDYTGHKYNNPYGLIQKAGTKRRTRRTRRMSKSRKTKRKTKRIN